MKKILCLVLALAMVLSLAACGGASSSAASSEAGNAAPAAGGSDSSDGGEAAPAGEGAGVTLKIGFIGPLTGAAALYGIASKQGAELAAQEINALGGLQIELNCQDDEHDAEKSVNAYNNLKDWGMQALVGPVTSTPCLAVAAEAQADGYFLLTGSASSQKVIEAGDHIFQVCFTDPNQGVASADYIAENFSGATVGILYDSSDVYSSGIKAKFEEEAGIKGLTVADVEAFTGDNKTDFTTQLQKLQSAGVDVLFMPFYYTEASLVLTQANGMGYEPTFFGVDGMDGILDVEGFDTSLAEGVYLLTPFVATKGEHFSDAYEAAFNETPIQFAADFYDCVYAIYQAALDGGLTSDSTPEEVAAVMMDWFTTNSFDGVTGEAMTWDAGGAVSKAPKAMIIENGVYVAA